MIKKYRVVTIIKALQLTWDTWDEMCDFAGVGRLIDGKPEGKIDGEKISLHIPTPEGLIVVSKNDWVIKEVDGKLHICKPGIFEKIYEEVIREGV